MSLLKFVRDIKLEHNVKLFKLSCPEIGETQNEIIYKKKSFKTFLSPLLHYSASLYQISDVCEIKKGLHFASVLLEYTKRE
jgi:hypothetical protein